MPFVLAILAVLTGVLTWMFAAAGLRRSRTFPGADWTELVPGIVIGLVTVLLAGMGILAAKVNRQRADIAARIAQSPDRPWLHVAQWDQGRIQDLPAKQAALLLGGFAAMWNAVVIGVALLARGRDDLRSDTTVLVFLAIFGLAGLGLIAGTVYMALAARKFSPAVFEMSSVPGVLGGWLRGTLRMPPQVPEGTEARVSWLLSISAHLPGVDYSAVFDVPVFPTEASDKTFVTRSDGGTAHDPERA